MANNCYFEMKIAGKEQSVEEFVQMLKWEGPFKNSGLGRVYSFDVNPTLTEKSEKGDWVAVYGQGDCAWSILTAMREWERRPLLKETERLGLVVEAYSSEAGLAFQEHILADKGKMIVDDCIDYEEYWVEGMSEQEILELSSEQGLTREELISKMNCNGDYCVGGFEDFGNFKDLFPYLEQQQKPSLDAVIFKAKTIENTSGVKENKQSLEKKQAMSTSGKKETNDHER